MQCTRLEKATLVANAGAHKHGSRCSADGDLFHRGRVVFGRAGEARFGGVGFAGKNYKTGGLTMNRTAIALSIATAFAAGCGVTHLLRPALAADTITAQVIHTSELEGDAISAPNAGGMRNKTFVSVDGATISIQDGSPPKHLHANANEIQYILEGKGTIWLGDKEVQVKQGDLIVIPKGTPHGGTKPDGRTIKAIAIKTPPQAPDDVKLLN
jgi:mannose-6-phosphate isomerase-like protein (cupin superfamily)